MKPTFLFSLTGIFFALAHSVLADDFEIRILGGSIQLGGEITLTVKDADKTVPPDASCALEIPSPYSSHLEVLSAECSAFRVQQGIEPLLDDGGYALPSAQVPLEIVVQSEDGSEAGRAASIYPYNNQFSELRVLIKDIRNPVSAGQSFEAIVLGAGQPIADSLYCRWNTYGPVRFEPTSRNECVGRITALPPDGRDGDIDVEIVNLTDMHAVGYAIAKILVK